jgi:hypothetical protein
MSRAVVNNEKYRFAFGVDHTPMGCFFQVYEKAAKGENPELDETDTPHIDADEMFGLRINHLPTLERNPVLAKQIKRLSYEPAYLRTEETIINIGKVLGFDIAKRVYELWD